MNILGTSLHELKFLLIWVMTNTLIFWIGWVTGGNDLGLGTFKRLPHNIYYGFAIGLAQCFVMSLVPILDKSGPRQWTQWLWPVMTSLGFVIGVAAVYPFIGLVTWSHSVLLGFIFGTLIGGCVTLAQALVLFGQGLKTLNWWYFGSMGGWLSGEIMDGALGYAGIVIPLTGTVIGLGSAIGLLGSTRAHYSALRKRAINV